MNKIYVFCNGGFGNRFYSLLTGFYIAYRSGRDPTVIWPVNNWCGAAFDDIFDSDLAFETDLDYQQLINSKATRNILHNNFFDPSIDWIPLNSSPLERILSYIAESDRDVVVGTDSLAWFVEPDVLRFGLLPVLPFKKSLQDRAAEIIKLIGSRPYYSLHLRKTDAYQYANEQRLYNIVDSHPDKFFFVCSDDHDTELEFAKRSNVFLHKKDSYVEKLVDGNWRTEIVDNDGNRFPFNVNRPKLSVEQAIVDLLLLSRGDLSYNESNLSSFLTVAKLLQQNEIK